MTRISFRQRYEQVEKIGAGGMGEVFKGRDPRSGRWVAIKLLHAAIAEDKTSLLRFEREIKTQAELDHTNIAPLFGVEDFKEGPCMIMQYVDGVGLNRLIAADKPLQPSVAFRILDGILAGMAHAHGAGIIHRDLKPSNVLIGKRGIPKIIDFGIAKPEADQDVTRMGSAPGTVSYMAPELHTASQPASTRSDVFSLGIIGYELFTGKHPFRRESEFATTQAILANSPPAMNTMVPGLPEPLSRVILTALEKDPLSRPKTAEEFRAAIANCGLTAAPEQEVRTVVQQFIPLTPGRMEDSASSAAVRAPASSGLSRPVFGLLRLNWMIYAAIILLFTAGAVAYLAISFRKPAQAPSEAVTVAPVAPAPPPAEAVPQPDSGQPPAGMAPAAQPATPPAGGLPNPAAAENPPVVAKKPAVESVKAARPAAVKQAPKADPAAEKEENHKKAVDLLLKGDKKDKSPDDK